MNFRGRILQNGEILVMNVSGTMNWNEKDDGWMGTFMLPTGRAIQSGKDYTLMDERGATLDIKIVSIDYGKERTAQFKSIDAWR